jgi:class 3 adenylate cyclase
MSPAAIMHLFLSINNILYSLFWGKAKFFFNKIYFRFRLKSKITENKLRPMTAQTPKKRSFLRILVSFCIAGTVILTIRTLEGSRLGPHYDFLMNYRPAPPVSQEILLIETGDEDISSPFMAHSIIEPSVVATVLMAMTELDSASLIIDAPILGLSSGEGEDEEEILRRFNGEFSLLGRNIRNLFNAIRMGAVAPEESDRFVEELVNLTEQGKERLISALIHRDDAGMERFNQAAAVFGRVRLPEVSAQTGSSPPGDARPGLIRYAAVPPDGDGRLRRIVPVRLDTPVSRGFLSFLFPLKDDPGETPPESGAEHIVYSALKDRYRSLEIEYLGDGPVLFGTGEGEGKDMVIPLDRNGAILFEAPRQTESFRHIPLAAFREYDQADRTLYRLLKEGEGLGIYNDLAPENQPSLIYEHALSLRDALLQNPDPEKKASWIAARKNFFISMEDFLSGPAETNLVAGYESLIAGEDLGEEGIGQLRTLRDELINAFKDIRRNYMNLRERRESLASALSGSFCILGSAASSPIPVKGAGISASALLANAFLTGRAINPGTDRYILFWSLICALFVCLCVGGMGTLLSLSAGFFLTALAGFVFSYSFIINAYWIDPVIPMAGAGAGVLVSSCFAFIIRRRYIRWLRNAYEPFVSRNCLRRIIRTGTPSPSQYLTVRAAIITVRNTGLTLREDREEPLVSARETLDFRAAVSRLFTRSGAVIAGSEGDLVLVAFGSPPERNAAREGGKNADPGTKAAGFVAELVRGSQPEDLAEDSRRVSFSGEKPDILPWNFGIDVGECTFAWSPQSGYTVFGRPVVRSRILSSLASRYQTRILISPGINEKLASLVVRKLGTFNMGKGEEKEVFYELLTEKTSRHA